MCIVWSEEVKGISTVKELRKSVEHWAQTRWGLWHFTPEMYMLQFYYVAFASSVVEKAVKHWIFPYFSSPQVLTMQAQGVEISTSCPWRKERWKRKGKEKGKETERQKKQKDERGELKKQRRKGMRKGKERG
ncbi:hypothetical protein FIBSPDRAFT_896888 [Athelia psychrophila]|uniref:Uncharacterized protein n=1 Tax=Athelia psychrophila TaxID=1759441 RepID=A0A166CVP7_9AGAM|nr:hypothetical protein FIBSPDRAFT_896888 [Fibularhizoctonia sp. CBS 109695]